MNVDRRVSFMSKSNLASIPMIVDAITKESEVRQSLHMFLTGVVHLTGAERGEIYRLYLERSRYLSQVVYEAKEDRFSFPPADAGLDANVLLKSPMCSA